MEIPLSKGKLCLIDESDAHLLMGFPPSFDGRYACITVPNERGRKKIYVHRLITGITSTGKKIVVDHINGNKLDNRRENLRIVSQSINLVNREKPSRNALGFPGVHFSPMCQAKGNPGKKYLRKKPYKAEIKFNGRKYSLGRFVTAAEAHKAYCAKAKELFGLNHVVTS